MMMANNSVWTQLKQQTPELLKEDKVGAFILANKVPAMLQGGTLVSRSASTKHAAAAQALVEFLGTPDSTCRPPRSAVWCPRSRCDRTR